MQLLCYYTEMSITIFSLSIIGVGNLSKNMNSVPKNVFISYCIGINTMKSKEKRQPFVILYKIILKFNQ